MKTYAVTFAAILAAALATGCDRSTTPEPTAGVGGATPSTTTPSTTTPSTTTPTTTPPSAARTPDPTTPSTTTPPTAGAADPSLPPAGPAVGGEPGATQRGADTKANKPDGELTKREESAAMPTPGQVNNHSTPNRGTTPTKP